MNWKSFGVNVAVTALGILLAYGIFAGVQKALTGKSNEEITENKEPTNFNGY